MADAPVPQVTLADIEAARELIRGVAIETPMEQSRWLSALVGGPVWLKCENLQRTGSFKIRGAYVRISRLTPEERARGVVAASAGNHAQGVALAAQLLGHPVDGLHARGGADPQGEGDPGVRRRRGLRGQRARGGAGRRAAVRRRDRRGADPPVRPRRHRRRRRARSASRCSSRRPTCRPCWCRPAAAGCSPASRSRSRRCGPTSGWSACRRPARRRTRASLAQGQPGPAGVDEDDGRRHRGRPARRHHLRRGPRPRRRDASPSPRTRCPGPLLALVERAKHGGRAGRRGRGRRAARPARTHFETPVVAVLSGGNIDPLLLGKVIRHGMAAAGRYLNLHVTIPDTPGGLAQLLTEVGAVGANVLEVVHERISPRLHLDEVEVHLQLETRGDAARRAGADPAPRARLPGHRVSSAERQPVNGHRVERSRRSSVLAVGRLVARPSRPCFVRRMMRRRRAGTAGSRP